MKPSAYMRRNTKGVLKTNPPLSSFGKKRTTTRRPAARTTAARKHRQPRRDHLHVTRLGQPLEITYRHHHGGTYRHRFNKGAQITYTNDGAALVITGIDVKAFIEG